MREGDPSSHQAFSEQPTNERPDLRLPNVEKPHDPSSSGSIAPTVPEGSALRPESVAPDKTQGWQFPGHSLSGAFDRLHSERDPTTEERQASWRRDFNEGPDVPAVESREDLTTQLEAATHSAGWNSLSEFFTAVALKGLYASFDRLTRNAPEGRIRGSDLLSPLERPQLQGEKLDRSPEKQQKQQEIEHYHRFVRDLIAEWKRRGVF
jgi:hypothetical protein